MSELKNLRDTREGLGLSRPDFARRAGLSDKTVERAEAGENVSNVTKNRIVNAFKSLDKDQAFTLADFFPEPAVER